ncbi:MAG: hypothetical protein RI920_1352, partial [Pseudomonadota bacterium]
MPMKLSDPKSPAALRGALTLAAMAAALALTPVQALAAKLKLCVYDPSGANGEAFRAATDYRLEMAQY